MSKATSVIVNSMNAARVRNSLEWATICWRGWTATGIDGKPRECGEILIHSTFGSWGHAWHHLGVPFDQWLPTAELAYCAEKFMGSKAYKFDGTATVTGLRRHLIELRQHGELTKAQAREVWDWIANNEDCLESGSDMFCVTMQDGYVCCDSAKSFFEEPWEMIRKSLDTQFIGFWGELWPVFIDHIKSQEFMS